MIQQISPAMSVFGQALDSLHNSVDLDDEEKAGIVQSNVSCHGRGEVKVSQPLIFEAARPFSQVFFVCSGTKARLYSNS